MHVSDPVAARAAVDPLLSELFPRWRYGGIVHDPDGTHWLEYGVAPPEIRLPQEVLYEIRTRSHSTVLKAELV